MKRFPLSGKLIILLLALTTVLPAGCSRKPMVAVCPDSAPLFTDDLDLDSLKKAVRSNLDYLRKQPPEKSIIAADRTFPLSRLTSSLEHFLDILAANPSPTELDRLVRQQYDIFQATGTSGFNPARRMLITGYFQPVFAGSLSREAPFLYPLYSVPDDLATGRGDIESSRAVPYWTRREIETENRAAGHELVWLTDPFDA
ncbi:MAG TPA: hypothetical protein ENO11_00430, partial [Desulfobacteraceae bacterium]|nr:hypothetical protein [Desulfobacteraceae bacterium]